MIDRQKFYTILNQVTQQRRLQDSPDVNLYQTRILDDLKTVQLIYAFNNQLGLDISANDYDEKLWQTPNKILNQLEILSQTK
ncbi:D-alanine--poly(phosphoribitol) ligase subunit 2 [Holzapfeliella sp. He02]|uniref:D-alanine--poly(Phosphoribitol) ligase subunit 2 n=1 Tax=Holzapfeliella saturejae TaxID=3082953 RepID=A0ABU8SH33_9LACO